MIIYHQYVDTVISWLFNGIFPNNIYLTAIPLCALCHHVEHISFYFMSSPLILFSFTIFQLLVLCILWRLIHYNFWLSICFDLILVHNRRSAVLLKHSISDDNNQAGLSKVTFLIKKYYCTGCCQPVKDIKRYFITSALASLCWYTFFQLSDNKEKIGPYTFELPIMHGLLSVLTLVFILIIRIPFSLAHLPRGVSTIIAHHMMSCLLTYICTYQIIAL